MITSVREPIRLLSVLLINKLRRAMRSQLSSFVLQLLHYRKQLWILG
jgi:hypothetical protein